jgi:hypothetical protein
MTADPVKVTVSTESLEKNEPLNETLKGQNKQTIVLNEQFTTLNSTLSNRKEELLLKQQYLESHDIDVVDISNQEREKYIMIYSLLFVISMIIWFSNHTKINQKLYEVLNEESKRRILVGNIIKIIACFLSVFYSAKLLLQ